MSIDANFTERLRGVASGPMATNTTKEKRRAVMAVLSAAEDAQDAAILLEAFGLMDAARELWHERGTRR
jgi:hypothetical protein